MAGILVLGLLAAGCTRGTQPRGWAAPARAGSLVLVSAGKGHLDGLDAQTKERRWRFPGDWSLQKGVSSKLTGIYGAAVLSPDGVVYVGDYNGSLYAFRPGDHSASGDKPKATGLKLGGPIIGGLALDSASGFLFVSAGNKVYKLQSSQLAAKISSNTDATIDTSVLLTTGQEIWGAPVISGGKVFVASLDGNLYALDATTGAEAWRFTSGHALASTPVITGSLILVGGFDRRMHAIDIASGNEKWSVEASNWVWSRPAVGGGHAYFGDFDGNVYAVDLASGEKTWSTNLDKGTIRGGPAIAGGVLVVGTEAGWLAGIDPTSHATLWTKKIETSINADLVAADNAVLIAPSGCVSLEGSSDKAYYTSVDPTNGELTRAQGVC